MADFNRQVEEAIAMNRNNKLLGGYRPQIKRVPRKPADIARDPMLSNALKIELLKSIKEHNTGAQDPQTVREADLALEQMLRLRPSARH